MLIGIDASRLTEKNRTGTENYLYYVVNCLSKIDDKNKYILYFREQPSETFWNTLASNNKNFYYKVVKKYISWTQISLSIECIKDHVNVLLCTWHTVPIFHKPSMKIVSVIHGMEYFRMRGGPTIYTILFSDRVIAVSEYTKSEILKLLPVKENKIIVIYEGVDTSVYYKRNPVMVEKVKNKYEIKGKYLFYVGTFGIRKNIPNMIKAFHNFIKDQNSNSEFKDITFVLGGKIPPEYEAIRELTKSLNIEKSVKFLSYVPEEDLPELISGAHALMYVSKSEGFGLPVLESLSCGIKVITSNVSATKEIGDGFVYFADPNNIDQMTGAINKSFSDAVLYNDKDLVSYLKTNFDWYENSRKILSVLIDLN